MIKANNGYNTLKSVIVGRELELSKRMADITFKVFYKENLGEKIYEDPKIVDYKINHKVLQERIQDLDNLAKTLEDLGVKVYRPEKLDKVVKINTPYFNTELSSASNVRDLTFVYQNKLIETPTFVRNRYFENINMNDIFYDIWDKGKGGIWIKSPFQKLTEDTIDLEPWNKKRDFNNIPDNFEMAIDGAQYMRINENECFVNISTYNHYLGHLWVKQHFPDVTFYEFYNLIDNHIDGAFNILKDGVFLVNPKYSNLRDIMPEKFKDWTYLYPEDTTRKYDTSSTNINIQLASERGMDINVLSVFPDTVIVSEDATGTIEILEKNNFNAIPIQFRHSEIFAGGIHCSTLDLWREE